MESRKLVKAKQESLIPVHHLVKDFRFPETMFGNQKQSRQHEWLKNIHG